MDTETRNFGVALWVWMLVDTVEDIATAQKVAEALLTLFPHHDWNDISYRAYAQFSGGMNPDGTWKRSTMTWVDCDGLFVERDGEEVWLDFDRHTEGKYRYTTADKTQSYGFPMPLKPGLVLDFCGHHWKVPGRAVGSK